MFSFAGTELSSVAAIWVPLLLEMTWKATLVLVAAGLGAMLLRGASAAVRHLLWMLALGSLLAIPLLSVVLPEWRVPLLPALARLTPAIAQAPASAALERPAALTTVPATALAHRRPSQSPRSQGETSQEVAVPPPAMGAVAAPPADARVPWTAWAVLVWLAGALVIVGRLAMGMLRAQRIAAGATAVTAGPWRWTASTLAAQIGVTRPLRLLRTPRATTPMTWGFLNPVVLIPEEGDRWTHERRRVVLLHEIAHVKRADALIEIGAQLVYALYWFHPLTWLAARALRAERERACDDYVLAAGARGSDYAGHLLEIVRSLGSGRTAATAACAMARRSQFEGRLLAILDPAAKRGRATRGGALLTAAAVLSLVLPLSALRPLQAASDSAAERGRNEAVTVQARTAPRPARARVRSASAAVAPVADTMRRDRGLPAGRAPDRQLAALEQALAPETPTAALAPLSEMAPATLHPPVRRDQRETLIAVLEAASRMKSDAEKATLLVELVRRYMAGDVRGATIAQRYELGAEDARDAFFHAVGTIGSDFERRRVLSAVLERRAIDRETAIAALYAVTKMTSSVEKANVLTLLAGSPLMSDADFRAALFDAAATIENDLSYRTVMSAMARGEK